MARDVVRQAQVRDDMTRPHSARYHGLLGTVLELRIEASDHESAVEAEHRIVSEIIRLERVFSIFRPDSELSRWARGGQEPGLDLATLLEESLIWQQASRGAYNPEVGALADLWAEGAWSGAIPDPIHLDRTVRRIARAGYSIGGGGVRVIRPLNGFSLNAMAKGWIVDRATRVGLDGRDAGGVMVNAGGDLLNLGTRAIPVAIEDPLRRYDNVPPIARVLVPSGRALATSGGARRGWHIDGSWYSHVIDPRSGWPAVGVASATAMAATAAEADVVATILNVLDLEEGIHFVEGLDDVASFVVDADGGFHRSGGWDALDLS